MSRKSWITVSLLVLLGALASFSYAQTTSADVKDLEKQSKLLDDQAAKQPNDKTFQQLSKDLGVSIEILKAEKQGTGFGFGQLFIANALATASKKPFEQIADEFRQGKGWGQIAQENNVKLGTIVSGMRRSNTAIEKAHNGQTNSGHGAATKGKSGPPQTGRGSTGRSGR